MPTHDRDEIRRALGYILEPGQITELRALGVTSSAYMRPHTVSGYFDNWDALADAAAAIEKSSGIFFVPNVPDPRLLARCCNRVQNDPKNTTSDGDIVRRRYLLVDCDSVRPAGISASDEEHDAAIAKACEIRETMIEDGWPEPILADSGNGAHLLWRVDLAGQDGGVIERCIKALAVRFSDDKIKVDEAVHNPARIWKLYGTRTGKGDAIGGRPHRLSKIIAMPLGGQ